MRAVLQRVTRASVAVEGEPTRSIDSGLVVLLGVGEADEERHAHWMARKIAGLRIFADEEGKMNRSVNEVKGEVLVISQFTLYGDSRKGRRPSFAKAGQPEKAKALYQEVVRSLRLEGVGKVETGTFQAMMDVSLTNHGPVTLVLDTEGVVE